MESSDDKVVLRNLAQRVNIGDSLRRTARRTPTKTALIEDDRRLSYVEFNQYVNRLANGLMELGAGLGTPIALMSRNSIEFLVTYYACAKIGAICVPINLLWREDEVAYVLTHGQVEIAIAEGVFLGTILKAAGSSPTCRMVLAIDAVGELELTDEDPILRSFIRSLSDDTAEPSVAVPNEAPVSYLYTSGTTSAPKGVVSSQLAIYLESMGTALDISLSGNDRIGALMPMFHTAQLNGVCTSAILVGATIDIMKGFDAALLLSHVQEEKLTMFFGLPMMFRALLEHDDFAATDLSSLRLCVYAMAPMSETLLRRCISEFDCDFALLFGQTEMAPVSTIFRPEHQLSHLAAVGTPGVNTDVAILSGDGKELPPGAIGEICYRSPQLLSEYLRNEAATDEVFRFGWFHSGDVGRLGDDGMLWFEDRFKDVIKTGGENVASIEVERAIYQSDPRIAEVAVIGVPHPHWSEAITAVIVPQEGATLDEVTIRTRLREMIDAYKIPKAIIIAESLPHTSTGKIQKNLVRDAYQDLFQESELIEESSSRG
jgi:long-chain acyl-CoA synthetase